ncbi:MAG: tetratricopeptide repeat protein [Pseudomonadales bacterium]|nr:tetratricopeptide repeat protein [Pseudomonadales bacterium]
MRRSPYFVITFCVLLLAGLDAQAQCPPLNALYPLDAAGWDAMRPQIERRMPDCLSSAEYFALLGAARLNGGDLPGALEALERALLIDPSHGAAQLDYAEALHQSGQLFAALELNRGLLERRDLPANLQPMLRARQELWNRERRRFSLLGELAAGYDSNLNGAPASSEVVLTLSGESVTLTLNPDFQPQEGAYANTRVVASYSVLSNEDRQDLLLSLRSRASADHASDLTQLDWRYGYTRDFYPGWTSRLGWEVTGGTSHLLYGGSPLYSVLDLRNRLLLRREIGCSPLFEIAAQYQRYHGQSIISGVESSLGGGWLCQSATGRSTLELQAGYLRNDGTDASRPGGDRQGWRLQAHWQYQLGQGALDFDAIYARLDDQLGYSPLLNNGAARDIDNYQLRLQYQYPFTARARFFTRLNYQNQNSNLVPFRNDGTAFELGLRYQF